MIETAPAISQRGSTPTVKRDKAVRGQHAWGPVEALLALAMLPFATGFLFIDLMVMGISNFTNRVSSHTGGLRRTAAR